MLEVHAHTESCRAARFINGGRAILTGSPDCLILATDVETGSTIARLDDAHEAAINRLINLTESTVASGDDEGCIKLDEDRIITGSENRIINLVGILPNRVIQPIAEHSEYPVECLAFSHDRKFLGSISHDQMLKLWDLDNILQGSGNTQSNEAGAVDSDDDAMDLDDDPSKNSKGNKRKNANNGNALGGSNNFFSDL